MADYVRVKRQNLYHEVANQLDKMIMQEHLKIGDRLPSEQELAQRFGVSRNVVREALKGLSERGLIERTPGKGAFIAKPSSEMIKDILQRLIVLGNVSATEMFEIRIALESQCAGYAAERATAEDLERLERIVRQMPQASRNIDEWVLLDLEFHIAIAQASKNALFKELITPLVSLFIPHFKKGYRRMDQTERVGIHAKIYNAIKSHKADTAMRLMEEHIQVSRQLVVG